MASPWSPVASSEEDELEYEANDATCSLHSCVLLDWKGYLADRRNATTAEVLTRAGHTEVSFWIADPPAVSHFCVHCPEAKGDSLLMPFIIGADGPFVLLRLPMANELSHSCEYLLYKAGPGQPSLHVIPHYEQHFFNTNDIGLLQCDSDGEHFVVAALYGRYKPRVYEYDLHIFSSKTWAWSSKMVVLDLDQSCEHEEGDMYGHDPDKVIPLGGGRLGWVDLWRGILVCNVLDDDDHAVHLIPPPYPMIEFVDDYGESDGRPFRDVTCSGKGLIRFIEMEFLDDDYPSDGDSVTESSLDVEKNIWKTTVWSWMGSSWSKGFTVDVRNIWIEPGFCHLLPELLDDQTQKPTLMRLATASPTLMMDSDDVVYLMSKVDCDGPEAWVIAVDMKNNALKGLSPYSVERIYRYSVSYRPCDFSKYLNITQGVDVLNTFDMDSKRYCLDCIKSLVEHIICKLIDIETKLKYVEESYKESRSLVRCCHPLSRPRIQAMVEDDAPGNFDAKPPASYTVGKCLQAFEHIYLLLPIALHEPSTPVEAYGKISPVEAYSKICDILQPSINLVQAMSSMVLAEKDSTDGVQNLVSDIAHVQVCVVDLMQMAMKSKICIAAGSSNTDSQTMQSTVPQEGMASLVPNWREGIFVDAEF